MNEEKHSYENYVREEMENIVLNSHLAYLKNVREIEYGKFLVGYENEDGLNLVYNNIGSAIYEEIVNDIKEDGFMLQLSLKQTAYFIKLI